jgi:hypothetical protein
MALPASLRSSIRKRGYRPSGGTPSTPRWCAACWTTAGVIEPNPRGPRALPERQADEWTIRELAAELGLPQPTLYNWVRAGHLSSRSVSAGTSSATVGDRRCRNDHAPEDDPGNPAALAALVAARPRSQPTNRSVLIDAMPDQSLNHAIRSPSTVQPSSLSDSGFRSTRGVTSPVAEPAIDNQSACIGGMTAGIGRVLPSFWGEQALAPPHWAEQRVNIRFRFQAMVTRLHSLRTLSSPRSRN